MSLMLANAWPDLPILLERYDYVTDTVAIRSCAFAGHKMFVADVVDAGHIFLMEKIFIF